MVFEQPLWLMLILLLPIPWLILRGKGYVGHSAPWIGGKSALGKYIHLAPAVMTSVALALLFVALARPQHPYNLPEETIRARDIVVAVDKSGSMGETFAGEVPKPVVGTTELDKALPPLPKMPTLGVDDTYSSYYGSRDDGQPRRDRRIDAAQAATLNFVRDRYVIDSGDRVGVMVFDTRPYWAWPMSRDLRLIYRNLQIIATNPGGGTNFGLVNPGPIDAAVAQFEELGQSNTRVLIMVTDGEDDLDNAARSRLLGQLKDNNIRLYVIGVGPRLAYSDVPIIRLAEDAGGKIFRVENANDLVNCFATINSLEQSPVSVPGAKRKLELFWYFAGPAIFFFLLAFMGEAVLLKQ